MTVRSRRREVEVKTSNLSAIVETLASSVNGVRGRMPRVAIVGTGFVGSTAAYALLMSGTPAEIVLVDRDRRRAEGHAQDLRDAEVFTCSGRISVGEFCDCCSADVTIITIGVGQAGLKSRLDGLNETAPIVKGLVQDIAQHNPRGILLIASNPVDVLTYAAWKWSGLPPSRVIGAGTALDTSRLRRRLAAKYEIASDHVHAYVVGEHGDSQVLVLSSARVAGIPLDQICQKLQPPHEEDALEKIADETRLAGLEIIDAKGATYFGIGAALARIVRAILRDENAVLTVSGLVPESMGLGEVSLSLPAVINRDGIARVLSIPLNFSERRALEGSANLLKQHIATLGGLVSQTGRELESLQYET
jgi:L-lactate dehydrogenase